MGLVVVTFQIPLTEDREIGRRTRHPPFRWKALQDALHDQFGGRTEIGKWPGNWRSSGSHKATRDTSRAFQVDVPEERLEEVRALLRRASKTFVQRAIRVIIKGEAEYLEGGPDDPPL